MSGLVTYPTLSAEKLRSLCIQHGWFTAGSIEQYHKLFEVNACAMIYRDRLIYDVVDYIKSLAAIIWLCSSGTDELEIFMTLMSEYRILLREVKA